MKQFLTAFVVSVPLATLASQTVHIVGPGGFPQIAAALAVAAPGDILVVSPGIYEPFSVDIGVSIIATGTGTVEGRPGVSDDPHRTRFAPAAQQTVHVRGLHFRSSATDQPHFVSAEGGQVVFENCTFSGGFRFAVDFALECTDADVVLHNCLFDPLHSALLVDGGSLVATDTRVLPRDTSAFGVPRYGIEIRNASAKLSWCELRGISADSSPNPGWPAMLVTGSAAVWMTESTISGGDAMGLPPVTAIVNASNAPVHHWRCTITGGLGIVWLPFGIWTRHGPPFHGPEHCAPLLGAIGNSAGIGAGSYGFCCTCEPARIVIVVLTGDLLPPQNHVLALQPFRFDPGTATPFGLGITDQYGYYNPPLLHVPSGFFGSTVWLHPLMLDGNALQAGPVLGGIVR